MSAGTSKTDPGDPYLEVESSEGEVLYKCSFCDMTLNVKSMMIRHLDTHFRKKTHSCTVCLKSYTSHYYLYVHRKTHSGQNCFKCDYCKKSFPFKSAWSTHMRVHTGERPFKCVTCEKAFRTKEHLKEHQKTHTEEKCFVCNNCEKAFRRKGHLKEHQKTHRCTKYAKNFRHWIGINSHLEIHHGEKAFKCPTSEQSFSTRNVLTSQPLVYKTDNTCGPGTSYEQMSLLGPWNAYGHGSSTELGQSLKQESSTDVGLFSDPGPSSSNRKSSAPEYHSESTSEPVPLEHPTVPEPSRDSDESTDLEQPLDLSVSSDRRF